MRFLTSLAIAISILGSATVAKADSIPPAPPAVLEELRWQHRHGAISDSYWQRLGHCETGDNPFHHTKSYGGLTGVALTTWKAYGGLTYGWPWQVDVRVQYVIYNRISIFGYQTHNRFRTLDDKAAGRGIFMQPVGVGGWGCAHTMKRPNNKIQFHP